MHDIDLYKNGALIAHIEVKHKKKSYYKFWTAEFMDVAVMSQRTKAVETYLVFPPNDTSNGLFGYYDYWTYEHINDVSKLWHLHRFDKIAKGSNIPCYKIEAVKVKKPFVDICR